MSYSTDPRQFGDDAWYYNYGNGTIIYFNGSYSMNFVCNATTDSDPDIAGPGVIVAFIATAWITLFVASVPAFYQLLDWLNEMRAKLRPSVSTITKRPTETPYFAEMADRLLGSLCDLQVITGTAIVVAGLAQLPTISFYHQNLAINYWWLTLNSFWAARIEYMRVDFQYISGRVIMRRTGILISVILGLAFQSIINIRESRDWNFLGKGSCFLEHHDSSSWPWVVGTAVYAVSPLFTIIPFSRIWVSNYHVILDRGQAALVKWQRKNLDTLRSALLHPASGHHSLKNKVFCLLALITSSLSVTFYWLLRQFLAVWSYGGSFGPFFILIYIAYLVWNTYDIIDLKVSNKALINGSETHWGFGQVLPLVLMTAIGYAAVDAIPPKKKGGANTLIPLQHRP